MKSLRKIVVLLAVVGVVFSSYLPKVGDLANAGNCPSGWIEVTVSNNTECVYEVGGSLFSSKADCVNHCETNGVISSSIWYGAGAACLLFGPWGLVPGAVFGTVGYLTSTYGPSCEEVCAVP